MVGLVEVAKGVLESSDHLGTHPDRFLLQFVHETCFKCSLVVKDSLLVLHFEVDFEGVLQVLRVEIMTLKICLQLDFVYGMPSFIDLAQS